ncbi:hypothetical protein KBW71_01070 [Hydrogenophaga aromaticivorans]|uniref:A1S_2505 family phage non-structural protein n=1 Tax=Hydrogenophaga aromaticivorans TaxID=2610898 RepID=UPI001B39414F|nr:hypothetical protein [Hydrogenophaga aromaticivorans]MBQ0917021.1 hypothetical protein [Hydrogenophaga aromaticivorans]
MHVPRFHPDNTTPKGDGWIWVFGSNLAGRHGKGAAKVAKVNFGAAYGVGRGRTGLAYAIPTKDAHLQVLSLSNVELTVAEFLRYASTHPELRFFVTRVGCGLAGFTDDQIGPLFAVAPMNCSLPIEWMLHARNRGAA